MRVGVIGNTVLTRKTLEFLLGESCKVEYVFGLPPGKLKTKVNACDLRTFCQEHKIRYIDDNNWETILPIDVDVVYELGDSRIVHKDFLKAHPAVGNHGAELPAVQGAASLVWGRMLNSGRWGVSLMELNETIDGGDILVTEPVFYDKDITSMKEFVEMCDNKTLECLKRHFSGEYERSPNRPWEVKVAKNTDSSRVVGVLELCVESGLSIYLPPRRPSDGEINERWTTEFVNRFKMANDEPYPSYFTEK